MTDPPQTIDGANVLQVADLEGSAPTGRTRHTAEGVEVTGIAGLALAQYPGQVGVYLFYCDEGWKTLTDTYHDDLERAIAQAEYEFGPVQFVPVEG